ncbi:MAG: aminopeptidase [Puniceicoccales bacterium]|jgi:aminopeptidase|nr:aminopeptidase [Puniceicoccales bacterium]
MDPRYEQLAKNLVFYSMDVQPGENVLISTIAVPAEMIIALMRCVRERGGAPFLDSMDERLRREFLLHGTKKEMELIGAMELNRIRHMQCAVIIRGSDNIFECSDVPDTQQRLYNDAVKVAFDYRVNETRWVVLRWPNKSMAQMAQMSTENFEEFFFRVCNLDHSRMREGAEALKALMESTDRVHIKGPGVDLQFSIKGIPAKPCIGHINIPDGEIFTAPVKESVEGVIAYNAPSVYRSQRFENIRFTFERGKIVEATANDTKAINSILDSDEGARYIGEFAFGFNPYILSPIGDILMDEKIAGSFHFTPGQAYKNDADNGNRSQIHWDIVSIQRKDYGGGEIYFDGKLIRKDGLFVVPGPDRLNPDHLLEG